jgi:hypothetical protein
MTEGSKTCTGSSRETGFQSVFCDFPLALTPEGLPNKICVAGNY